jgi:hypothetical protein
MATHRDYKIVRFSVDRAAVRFFEGEYQTPVDDPNIGELATDPVYVRTSGGDLVSYDFASDCTYERLVDFLNDKLSSIGSLDSIPEQVRVREPDLIEKT